MTTWQEPTSSRPRLQAKTLRAKALKLDAPKPGDSIPGVLKSEAQITSDQSPWHQNAWTKKTGPLLLLAAFLVMFLGAPNPSTSAAEIRTDLSTRETYVGIPTVLRVVINNAVEHDTPSFPEVPGLTIEPAGAPSTRSQTSWVNGRRSQRTSIVYSFLVTPNQEGTFTIPPIQITADGITTLTEAVRVVATKSETGDLLFAEITGDQSQLYVGQSLQLTLKFWLRPYRNQEYRIELNEEEMWSCLSERTSWGMFEDRIAELEQQRKRPGGRRVLREDSAGQQREYLLYEITTKIYPDRAREIDAKDTRLIFNYPVTLGRSRSPLDIFGNDDFFSGTPFGNSGFGGFGNRITVTEARPIVAEIAVDPITVIPVPQQGRPRSYVGAVGKYAIKTSATPTKIKTSDPITLTIEIQGEGPMDVLRAPNLNQQSQLTEHFKIADESLAGTVNGGRKTFTTTLRPTNTNVTEIPGIKYSYFDPETESFVTISSDPIPIEVEEAEVLALSPSGTSPMTTPTPEEPSSNRRQSPERIASVLFQSAETLESQKSYQFWSGLSAVAFFLPPTLFSILLLITKKESFISLLPLRHRFKKNLDHAVCIEDIKSAVEFYLMQKFRITDSENLRSTLLGRVRGSGDYRLAERIERLFQGEQHQEGNRFNECVQEANSIVEGLERLTPTTHRPQNKASMIGIIAITTSIHWGSTGALASQASGISKPTLSAEQRVALLSSGCEKFRKASAIESADEAKRVFQESASDFQTLVDDGVRNDRLFYNLAEAYRYSGRFPMSLANYRSALAISPHNQLYYDRLLSLETERQANQVINKSASTNWIKASRRRTVLAIGSKTLQTCFWAGWICLWCFCAGYLSKNLPAMRPLIMMAALICGASGLLSASHLSEFQNTECLVIRGSSVEVRDGDGEQFTIIATMQDADNQLVDLLEQRGDWAYIQWEHERRGWIRLADGVPITR